MGGRYLLAAHEGWMLTAQLCQSPWRDRRDIGHYWSEPRRQFLSYDMGFANHLLPLFRLGFPLLSAHKMWSVKVK